MFATIRTVSRIIEHMAPAVLAEEWDNVGLQVGNPATAVAKVMVALDADEAVVAAALQANVGLLVVHHPLLYKPLRSLREDEYLGRVLKELIKNDLAVYVAHTNLDLAPGGVNTVLADRLGLEDVQVLLPLPAAKAALLPPQHDSAGYGLGRIGQLASRCPLDEFAGRVKGLLGVDSVRVCGEPARGISRVAVCGGSGAALISRAAALGADCLVTGDVKYHEAQEAESSGLAVIDAGHAATERIAIPALAAYLQEKLQAENFTTQVIWSESTQSLFRTV